MIVRVLNDGQYDVPEDLLEQLNALDGEATEALDRDDEPALDDALDRMVQAIRSSGRRLPDEELVASEVVVPPSDFTLAETRKLMSEQGFIPDLPA